MSGRTWEPTRKGAKELNRWLSKGKTVYTLRNTALNIAHYEDAQLYASHTFDRRSLITGEWMTGHLSASGLLAQEGTVYEQPPARREIGTPGPQVAAPTSQQVLDKLRADDRAKAVSRR
ncbi:hypothetical protein [Streptomyces achromogenes]|uniref:hypothetical protein n=1 Tax=Streptomyces achromogenes TaxID=67255 RepID=UPI0036A68D1D